jgi:starch-binding outer membrane protein, SusD/RagB family
LNRAEAYATPGSSVFDETLALADLNTLRVARGLATVALTGSALYEEILTQRRIELAFEGHRWFDLKRLGRDVIKEGTVSGAVNVPFTDPRILPAIPQREIDANPNLVQNTGY